MSHDLVAEKYQKRRCSNRIFKQFYLRSMSSLCKLFQI
ncbi:unnamed protein product [Tenebrio molitor]|nr:unnamed protein product [Tenebrio molitor]